MPATRGNILALTVVWAVLLWVALGAFLPGYASLWWILVAALGLYLLYLSYRFLTGAPPPRSRR